MTIDDALAAPGEPLSAIRAWSTATVRARLLEVAVAGALAAVLIILVWMRLRPDLAIAAATPFFWLKGLYTAALAVVMLGAVGVFARPGGSPWPSLATAGAVVAVMLIAAGVEAPRLPAALIAHVMDPAGAWSCAGNIVALAAPMLFVAGVGLRRVDLDRPGLMGLSVGLLYGAVAATVYGLHCQDSTFAFVALWYTGAIALCGLIGAAGLKALHRGPLGEPAGEMIIAE